MGSIMSTIASIKYILLSSSVSLHAYVAIILMASILAAAKAVRKVVLSKRSTMAPQLSDQCYIARLPEDVLLKIFIIATRYDITVYNSTSAPPPVRLAATCRYWRTIMLSYGTPWSVIYLTKASFTRHFSKYSREALLDVYWCSSTPPADKVDAFVSEHLHRICSLDGSVKPDPERRTPNWLFRGDGRSLQNIRLLGDYDGPRITDLRLFEDGVPQGLHTLSLWDVCPKLTGSGFGGLTSLELHSLHLGDSADEFKAVLAILKASPSLERLTLGTKRDWIPPRSLDSPLSSGERIPLLHLKHVSLHGPFLFLSMLLKLLQIPDTAECLVGVQLRSSNSTDPFDLLGPNYFSAACFAPLNQLSVRSYLSVRPPNHCDEIFITDLRFTYTRRPIMPSSMRYLDITPSTARDLTAIMKKYPTRGVTCLCVGWVAQSDDNIQNVDIMPILPRLPALTSLEYTVLYPEHTQHHVPCALKSVPTSDILLSESSTPSSLGDPALPVIRDIVFRVLQLPWGRKNFFAALDEVVWCAEVLESLAAFLRQFPALERLTLVSYNPDDSPSAQAWAKSALTRFGLDVRVSVRVEHLEDPYHARRVKAV